MTINWILHTDEYTKEQLIQLLSIVQVLEPEIAKEIMEAIKFEHYSKIEK